ncbi:hypothetical protein AMECASPLE_006820 [Ameca splendens]|uniref:Uncharacterized protein n=1 Tax=Ameca splendens TaxID=208324 RepID=A0ABV0XZD0_9TELE
MLQGGETHHSRNCSSGENCCHEALCGLKIVQHEKLNVPFRSDHAIAKRKTLQRLRIALQVSDGSQRWKASGPQKDA